MSNKFELVQNLKWLNILMLTGCQLNYNKFKIWKLLFHILLKGSQNILSLTGYDLMQITTGVQRRVQIQNWEGAQ